MKTKISTAKLPAMPANAQEYGQMAERHLQFMLATREIKLRRSHSYAQMGLPRWLNGLLGIYHLHSHLVCVRPWVLT